MRIGFLIGARGVAIELHSLIQEVVQAEEDGFRQHLDIASLFWSGF